MAPAESQSVLNDEHFPLLLVYLEGVLDEANIHAMTAKLDEIIDRAHLGDTSLFLVIDARHVRSLGAGFRKAFVAWESGVSDERFSRIGVRIMVLSNPIVRGAITAVSWFSPRAKGIVAVKNVDRAVAALTEKVNTVGNPSPDYEARVRSWFAQNGDASSAVG